MGRVETIGNCTLYLGDCLEILSHVAGVEKTLGKFDACVTDPPYGIGEDGGRFRGRKGQNLRVLPKIDWDSETPSIDVFDLMLSCSDEQIIWGGNYFADKLPVSRGWLYWQKLMGGDFSDGELAWTSRDRALREFTKCPKGQGAEHPTQKPVELMEWCLLLLGRPPRVIDPFMGSGTTGVACASLGLKFTGIEREETYFNIACRRIEEAYRQPRLFAEPQPEPKQEALFTDGALAKVRRT